MHCNLKKLWLKTAVISVCTGLSVLQLAAAQAQETARENNIAQKQDLAQLTAIAEDFLKRESNGHPGEVKVTVTSIDRNLKLAQCPNPQAAFPAGSRAWGKTSIALSCTAPKWTIYMPAQVSVMAEYYVAAMPLSQGHTVVPQDLMKVSGDLTKLPAGIFTDASQVIGRSVSISLMSGAVLKHDMLKLPVVILQGQTVTLKTIGQGFEISTDAKALNNASDGQAVQVKVASGEVIAGIARQGGQVEVTY
jgi:flagella basal body P-ring formation protein FlgA